MVARRDRGQGRQRRGRASGRRSPARGDRPPQPAARGVPELSRCAESSISTTTRCRRAATSKAIAARRPPRSSSFRRSCSIPRRRPDSAELAGHAGCAQAIAGLLRLLPLHRRRGQCYVPRDLLAAAGTSPEEFLAGDGGPNATRAVAAMIALAREHLSAFERGAAGVAAIAAPGLPAAGADRRSAGEDAGPGKGLADGKPRHRRLAQALADVPPGGEGVEAKLLRSFGALRAGRAIRGSRRARAR